VTQQDPEHGEAWNNIAAIWVQLDRNKEAFSALGECVKHKRDSWQVGRQGREDVSLIASRINPISIFTPARTVV
jgi:ferric-dicitrate binding protein FerR (iron transport regulator)